MKKSPKKKKQIKRDYVKKFAVLAITIIVAGAGVYLYKQNQYINSTDSTGSFSFTYPNKWRIEPYEWDGCCGDEGGPAPTEPDWSKTTKPITLHPIKDKAVEVTINSDNYGDFWDSYSDLKAFVKEDYFARILFDGIRKDGHKALFSRVDYLGPPDAKVESFTDHRYYFDNGKSVLRVEFREKYHHDWPDDDINPDVNNTQYLSDFEHIANSIKFIN